MSALLRIIEVGPWPMNSYLVICEDTGYSSVVDPGADVEKIMAVSSGTHICQILITHCHDDHIGALKDIKQITGVTVWINPADAKKYYVNYDEPLFDRKIIKVGNIEIHTVLTPGHTQGMSSFFIGENRVLVGDTIFVGGPGKTWTSKEFVTTMNTMENVVFKWSDDTEFFPGHGVSGKIGTEKEDYIKFVERGWPSYLYGDVTWK